MATEGTPEDWIDRADAETLRAEVEACVMTHTPPFDFAQCETHDETFPLGESCRFQGREAWEVYADEADEQRHRAVMALIRAEKAEAERGTAVARERDLRAAVEHVSQVWGSWESELGTPTADLLADVTAALAAHPAPEATPPTLTVTREQVNAAFTGAALDAIETRGAAIRFLAALGVTVVDAPGVDRG